MQSPPAFISVQLPNDNPVVQQHFAEGLHVARRSHRAWADLSTDLMIEQVIMRSMKTSGGLTRDRGMTEQHVSRGYLLCRHALR